MKTFHIRFEISIYILPYTNNHTLIIQEISLFFNPYLNLLLSTPHTQKMKESKKQPTKNDEISKSFGGGTN